MFNEEEFFKETTAEIKSRKNESILIDFGFIKIESKGKAKMSIHDYHSSTTSDAGKGSIYAGFFKAKFYHSDLRYFTLHNSFRPSGPMSFQTFRGNKRRTFISRPVNSQVQISDGNNIESSQIDNQNQFTIIYPIDNKSYDLHKDTYEVVGTGGEHLSGEIVLVGNSKLYGFAFGCDKEIEAKLSSSPKIIHILRDFQDYGDHGLLRLLSSDNRQIIIFNNQKVQNYINKLRNDLQSCLEELPKIILDKLKEKNTYDFFNEMISKKDQIKKILSKTINGKKITFDFNIYITDFKGFNNETIIYMEKFRQVALHRAEIQLEDNILIYNLQSPA
jgi:hypothetical protein